jgi:hypothetical protein
MRFGVGRLLPPRRGLRPHGRCLRTTDSRGPDLLPDRRPNRFRRTDRLDMRRRDRPRRLRLPLTRSGRLHDRPDLLRTRHRLYALTGPTRCTRSASGLTPRMHLRRTQAGHSRSARLARRARATLSLAARTHLRRTQCRQLTRRMRRNRRLADQNAPPVRAAPGPRRAEPPAPLAEHHQWARLADRPLAAGREAPLAPRAVRRNAAGPH